MMLDVVRCVAIGLLLMAHIAQAVGSPLGGFFGIHNFYYVSFGGLAVTIFLILSGMVLELQYGSRKSSYVLFIIKRCLRIYPIYYMSLLVGILVYFLGSYRDSRYLLSGLSKLGVRDLVLSITGLYAFAGKWGGPFINTSWFIALIMSMYVLFPFLSRLIKKRPNISIFALLSISTVSRFILGRYGILPTRPLDWFPLCRVFEFSLGIYLAILLSRSLWHGLNSLRCLRPLVSFISEISFPLFLIHYPLLLLIYSLTKRGLSLLLAVSVFIVICCTLSWIAVTIDKRIQGLSSKVITEGSTSEDL